MNITNLFWGIVFILGGALVYLKTSGIVDFSLWEGISMYWPIGLILAGIAFILKSRWAGWTMIILTVLIGGCFLTTQYEVGEEREFVQEADLEGITIVNLEMEYGAGDVMIGEGEAGYLRNRVKTTDKTDPKFTYKKNGNEANIEISREHGGSFFGRSKNVWDVEMSPDVEYVIDLDYGATDMDIDLKNLKVKEIDIDCGATGTEIIFSDYPTKVDIDTGASSLTFKFPEGAGVVIEVDGGAISTDFDDFVKKDGKHYSPGYDENLENIKINIDAGASSIEGSFY